MKKFEILHVCTKSKSVHLYHFDCKNGIAANALFSASPYVPPILGQLFPCPS